MPMLQEVSRRMYAIQSDLRALGIPFAITSTWRSYASQEALYEAYVARGRTGLPAARPGLSTHEYGIAFDASFPVGKEAIVSRVAKTHGMVWFGSRDRVHFDLFGPTAWNALLRRLGML